MRIDHERKRDLAGRVVGLLLLALAASSCARENLSLADSFHCDVNEIQLGKDRRLALASDVPKQFEIELELPPGPEVAWLGFSTAVESAVPVPRARVGFRVRVLLDGFPVTVHEETLRVADHNHWRNHGVDLAAWAGKKVTLSFETYPALTQGRVPWTNRVHPLWGDPRIEFRKPHDHDQRPRSVILIVVDTLRYDYLGVNGFVGGISPNLDWLAMESVRFDNAFATAPWTKPSVASILTGLYPETHGVGRFHASRGDSLAPEAVTLAEVLRGRGYQTAAFVGNGLIAPPYGFDQGFDSYYFERDDNALLDRIRSWYSHERRQPYFLYMHFIEAHGPYRAPERDYRLLRESPSFGVDRALLPTDPRRPPHLDATPFSTVEETSRLSAWKAKYAAAIHHVDHRLGALLNDLRSSGELDRALVVFASDHGEEFLEHNTWEHGYGHCGHQLHVPLWIRQPGAEGAGRRVTEAVSLVDIMPTVLRLNQFSVPAQMQGEDRSSLVEGAASSSAGNVVFSVGTLTGRGLHSLRTERYHFVFDDETGKTELFDLKTDPQETVNTAERNPELVSRFQNRLVAHTDELATRVNFRAPPMGIPDDLRDQLRDLGYIP